MPWVLANAVQQLKDIVAGSLKDRSHLSGGFIVDLNEDACDQHRSVAYLSLLGDFDHGIQCLA